MPSSMNEILVSLSRKGGVRDLPGDREGDAKGVVRRPDLRMDWGVNSANPEEVTDIAKVLAFYDTEQMEFTISVCKRHLRKDKAKWVAKVTKFSSPIKASIIRIIIDYWKENIKFYLELSIYNKFA